MPEITRITLNTIDKIHLVQVQDILYCKCNNSYTTFFIKNHEPVVISRSIKEVEKLLKESKFIRSHQSYLVNMGHISEVSKTNNYSIILTDNSQIPISIRKRKEIIQILLNN
jgi:two-component system LytT family response regulator